MDMTEDNFLFAIVMAIYKAEDYLAEAIESVVNQTLSFEKHVQLILVNDGSPDNSAEICLKYQQKYPRNIVYIEKENGGVSSARNAGLEVVEGQYINFLDSDDKLSENCLESVFIFFEQYADEVDVVSIPIEFFDGKSGEHILNYKYRSSRIIDLNEEYNCIQLSSSSSFYNREALEYVKFESELAYAEDALFTNLILLKKNRLGAINTATYYYRYRQDNSSAIQQSGNVKEWYNDYIRHFSIRLLNESKKQLGYVPEFIQYTIMYDLQWRLNIEKIDQKVLGDEEVQELYILIKQALQDINDQIIMDQRNLYIHRKVFALRLKYGDSLKTRKIFLKDNVLFYVNSNFKSSLIDQTVTLEYLDIKGSQLILEGNIGSLFEKEEIELVAICNGDKYTAKTVERKDKVVYSLNQLVKAFYGFSLTLPISYHVGDIQFYIKIEDRLVPVKIGTSRLLKLGTERDQYLSLGGYILSIIEDKLIVKNYSRRLKIKNELKYLKTLMKAKHHGSVKAALVRSIYHIVKVFKKKQIWLLMDRQDKADDNAEHLFRYSENKKDNIRKYFVINKESKDYHRLQSIGKTVAYGSYKHKILHLLSDKVISSHANDFVINPFLGMYRFYKDLFSFKFVFLQHGIIKDDLSEWLNKYNKGIDLFVTSAKPEYDSIVGGNYHYDHNVVKLTGLSRYDNLVSKPQRMILIMPTWRKSIVNEIDASTGVRPYNDNFKDSFYFYCINQLLNDEDLLDKAKEKAYRIVFAPHPNIEQQLSDFTGNDHCEFMSSGVSYQQLFNKASLLITDYSSVAFDVAYMQKPVIYYQFEENHLEEGYFDYTEMGFGEVCENHDKLIDLVCEYIDNDCDIKDLYRQRILDFFAYTDRDNCDRVYEAINQLE